MSQHVILTAIGNDRPGLVDEVSQFIFERGGNIEDSRMVNLRGQFAIMVLVSGGPQTTSRIEKELQQLGKQSSLHCEVHEAKATAAPAAEAIPYRLTATTLDQPGLVHRFSHLLRSTNANIESLETRLRPAPVTGAPMFDMEFVLSIPRAVSIAKLRQELGRVCDELNVDFQLAAV